MKKIVSVSSGLLHNLSRRRFFQQSGLLSLIGMFGAGSACSAQVKKRVPLLTYEDLGVRPFINCVGTVSRYSGFIVPPEVREEMDYASRYCVPVIELQEAVGKRIAEIMGAEAALVTTGASGSMHAGTAACVAGDDPEKISRLPDCTGMKNEVLVPANHRLGYDHAVRAIGVTMIEVNTAEEMEKAASDKTAMIFTVGTHFKAGGIAMEEVVRIGKAKKIPLFCDAAAEFPRKPDPYLQAGFDLVTYSGGKAVFGPQGSGILIGRKDLIQKALLNTAPNVTIGRALKVSKEEIMGTVICIELWFNGRDHDEEFRIWNGYAQVISEKVTQVPSVTTTLDPYDAFKVSPFLTISWDPEIVKISPNEVYDELFHGEPRIRMSTAASGVGLGPHAAHIEMTGEVPFGMVVRPYVLEAGQAEIVADRLSEVLLAHTA